MDMEDEYVIYLIVRSDIGMGKGKIAAQCGHAIQDLIISTNRSILKKYTRDGGSKVVFKTPSLTELISIRIECAHCIIRIPTKTVVDSGRTQVKEDTITVLGVGPLLKSRVPLSIRSLKLL